MSLFDEIRHLKQMDRDLPKPKDITDRMVEAHKAGKQSFAVSPNEATADVWALAEAVYKNEDERIAFVAGYGGAKKRQAMGKSNAHVSTGNDGRGNA